MDERQAAEILHDIWPEWFYVRHIGNGSYGNVYRIRREGTVTAESAVKIIRIPREQEEEDTLDNPILRQETISNYEGMVREISEEIRLMVSLKGAPNVVNIEDYCIRKDPSGIGWTILIRMELLTPLKKCPAFSQEDVIRLGTDICTILQICADRGIIHRDIKPDNILASAFGTFKLGDFGIARVMENTAASMTQGMGTANYMAPEVVFGTHYDFRADVYSLGLVLYVLLNRMRMPFVPLDKQLLNSEDRIRAYRYRMQGMEMPDPVDASAEMAAVIRKACAYDPKERYGSAAELKQALLAVGKTEKQEVSVSVRTAVFSASADSAETAGFPDTPVSLQDTAAVSVTQVVQKPRKTPETDRIAYTGDRMAGGGQKNHKDTEMPEAGGKTPKHRIKKLFPAIVCAAALVTAAAGIAFGVYQTVGRDTEEGTPVLSDTERDGAAVVTDLRVSLREGVQYRVGDTVSAQDLVAELIWDDNTISLAGSGDLRIENDVLTEAGELILQVVYRDMLTAGCAVYADYPEWVNAYAARLTSEDVSQYALAGVDDDAVPELILQRDGGWEILTWQGTEIRQCGVLRGSELRYVYRQGLLMGAESIAAASGIGNTWECRYYALEDGMLREADSYSYTWKSGRMEWNGYSAQETFYTVNGEILPEDEAVSAIEGMPWCDSQIQLMEGKSASLQADLWAFVSAGQPEAELYPLIPKYFTSDNGMAAPVQTPEDKQFGSALTAFMRSCAEKYDESIYTFNLIYFDGDSVPELAVTRDPEDPLYPADDIRGVQIYRFSQNAGSMVYIGTYGEQGRMQFFVGKAIIAVPGKTQGEYRYYRYTGEEVDSSAAGNGSIMTIGYDVNAYRYTPELVEEMASMNYYPQ